MQGSIAIVIFDDYGKIADISELSKEKGVHAVEIPAKKWHTLVSLEEKTVLYEIKDGPYNVTTDKQFADWAPDEDSDKAVEYLEKIKLAISGRMQQ